MRDFLPDDVRRRQYVIGIIGDVYQRYGFEPLETPSVENIETLIGKYGEEGDRLIFRILKRGDEGKAGEADLALRYDLTVPLARVIAEYRAQLPKFFKRYQVQPVWRADRPQKGRFREFYQCDVDAMGSSSPVVEAELCAAVSDVLLALGFNDFEIVINHRQLLTALLNGAGVDPSRHGDALTALDKFDKIGRDGVAQEFTERGIETDAASRLLAWMGTAWPADWLPWLEQQLPLDGAGRAGAENLRDILALTAATSAAPHIRVEPSLARGLSYYTGAIFEIKVKDLAGSLGGGGRYDNLVGMFAGEPVPAAGFSLGLERILVVMGDRKMFPEALVATAAEVMVTIWNADATGDAIRLARELRGAGLRVDVYPDADKIGKQFKYASARNIRFVAVLGEGERERNEVAIKNLTTGEQVPVPRVGVANYLLASLPRT
ncbi:MAG TPA: histidine--tRNA ligase [Vicinamibacterales bacterium]|nr:histidine--tRNA ligase [Vicinamibacterales bacterium]